MVELFYVKFGTCAKCMCTPTRRTLLFLFRLPFCGVPLSREYVHNIVNCFVLFNIYCIFFAQVDYARHYSFPEPYCNASLPAVFIGGLLVRPMAGSVLTDDGGLLAPFKQIN